MEKSETGKVLRKVLKTVLIIQVSLIAIGLIYFLFINTDNMVYKVLSSPVWGSLSAFVTAAGVYWGSKLGLKSAFDLEKKKLANEAEAKFRAFMTEAINNAQTFEQVYKFLALVDPRMFTPLSFSAVKIGISHIKRGAWEEFVKVNTYDEFNSGQFIADLIEICVNHEIAVNKAVRDIEMEIAEYERVTNDVVPSSYTLQNFINVKKSIERNINDALEKFDILRNQDLPY